MGKLLVGLSLQYVTPTVLINDSNSDVTEKSVTDYFMSHPLQAIVTQSCPLHSSHHFHRPWRGRQTHLYWTVIVAVPPLVGVGSIADVMAATENSGVTLCVCRKYIRRERFKDQHNWGDNYNRDRKKINWPTKKITNRKFDQIVCLLEWDTETISWSKDMWLPQWGYMKQTSKKRGLVKSHETWKITHNIDSMNEMMTIEKCQLITFSHQQNKLII